MLAFFFVLSGWASPLSCCCADINTTYSRGTAATMLPFLLLLDCCWCCLLHYGEGKRCPFFGRWCRRYAAHFTAVGAAFYTTGEGKCCPFFSRLSRRYAAHASAVSPAIYTTVRVNAARFSGGDLDVMLSILPLLVPPFTLRSG